MLHYSIPQHVYAHPAAQDLDHFLDSYLQQLHQGDNQQQGVAAMGAQGVYGLPGAGAGLGLGNVALGFSGQAGMAPGGFAGFGGMPGLGGLGAQGAGSLTGLAFLQQQQQALQQQQQQFNLGSITGLTPGAGGMAASMQAMPKSQAAGAATSKAKPKGKANTKAAAAAAKADSDASGSDSDENGSGSDEDGPRNRKRQATGGNMDDAERRHQALQEKNRRAQRRFRERQKVSHMACRLNMSRPAGFNFELHAACAARTACTRVASNPPSALNLALAAWAFVCDRSSCRSCTSR